jgi:hypothetical protein
MKFWNKLTSVLLVVGVFLVVGAIAFGVHQWLRNTWERRYSRVTGGMTVNQVREEMGRDEDQPDERTTEAGEFERSWTFHESGVRITVVFDRNGHSTYQEFGPSFCGVTPLMGKLLPRKLPN